MYTPQLVPPLFIHLSGHLAQLYNNNTASFSSLPIFIHPKADTSYPHPTPQNTQIVVWQVLVCAFH